MLPNIARTENKTVSLRVSVPTEKNITFLHLDNGNKKVIVSPECYKEDSKDYRALKWIQLLEHKISESKVTKSEGCDWYVLDITFNKRDDAADFSMRFMHEYMC